MRQRTICLVCLATSLMTMSAQDIKLHDYWIDSDYAHHQTVSNTDSISLTISTEGLAPGLHFFNHRALNTDNEWGFLNRMLFFISPVPVGDAALGDGEYWIDEDYAHKVSINSSDSLKAIIDIGNLEAGLHFFNYRAVNDRGEWGFLYRTMFFIPKVENGNTAIVEYEYWIDQNEPTRQNVTKTNSSDSLCATIDISNLDAGLHFFNYRAVNDRGEWGFLYRTMFFIPKVENGNTTIVEYEYWIDQNEPTRQNVDSFENELLLVIDVSGLDDGEHTFSFRAKNGNGSWGGLFTESFTIDKSQWEDSVKGLLIIEGQPFDVYTSNGVLVRQRATSLEGLQRGIYIIGGHKVIVN